MSTSEASRPSVGLASGVFFALLVATLLLSRPSDAVAHQKIMEGAGVVLFGLALISLRGSAGGSAGPQPNASGWALLPALALAVMTYVSMVSLGFISDDFTYLLWAPEPISRTWWTQLTQGAFGAFFRPLGFVSFAVDYRLWHGWAPGWHLCDQSLHLAATASLFCLCRELELDTETCGTAAAIFAVLPVGTEAIVWTAARFDLLAAFFMLWVLIFYLRTRKRGSTRYYWAALACFILALMSKEIAYITPFRLIAVEVLLLGKGRWRLLVPFFGIALLGIALRIRLLGSLGGYPSVGGSPGSLSLGWHSLQAILLRAPSELMFAVNWQQPRVVLGCLLAAATAALLIPLAALPRRESRGVLAFAALWCFFAALPAQSVLMISPSLVNARELYASAAGAALLMALLLARSDSVRWRWGWAAALLLCLMATTRHDIAAWVNGSRITRDLLGETKLIVSQPPPSAELMFHNLPRWNEGGVYLLLNRSLPDSIAITYKREDLLARRADDPPAPGKHPQVDLYWVADWRGKQRPLLASSAKPRE